MSSYPSDSQINWFSKKPGGSTCSGQTHSNLKLDKESEIECCQEYKYLGDIFYTSGKDDKEIRSRVIQARKFIACLNGILWSKDIRKERKLNIYNALMKSSLLYGSETWRLTENNKRRVEAKEVDALRRSLRVSRKERIRNVTIRQQIGLEETIIKEIVKPIYIYIYIYIYA